MAQTPPLPTGLVYDPVYKKHQPGEYHPESPSRCDAALKGISDTVPDGALLSIDVRAATEDEVALCHTREYIQTARRDVETGADCLSTGDTDVSEQSLTAAFHAAGGAIVAVDAVLENRVANAFCIVRPPGHHATADRGMGFCIFNNIAVAARHAQKRHGLERVLIVDWDIHHGNGTQAIFYGDNSVFYFSTHAWPFYPGTGTVTEMGTDAGTGFTLNCPFPPDTGGRDIIAAFTDQLVPAMASFQPELVLVSAGFDARQGDPIGNFRLTDGDYVKLTAITMSIAAQHANGRLVSIIEGGYNLAGLASAVGAHVGQLAVNAGCHAGSDCCC